MKGPSLRRQFNAVMEEIGKLPPKYRERAHIDVQCQSYDCADYPGAGRATIIPIRNGRYELHLDESVDTCDQRCKTCKKCFLWDIDGHYPILCHEIVKIGRDLY